jgi:shikimate dehydrogenase
MSVRATGAARVAGVAGRPIRHSLSPLLHNAWLEAAALDGLYAPFSPGEAGFSAFIEGLRGGVVRGLNITLPFKAAALALADEASPLAKAAGAANLLLFHPDGRIEARNTDGEGLLYAFRRQAPGVDLMKRPIAILGAGGAGRGAAATLAALGAVDIRIVNRSVDRAEAVARDIPGCTPFALADAAEALAGVGAVINATSAGLDGAGALDMDLSAVPSDAAAMDMVYKPLRTPFLEAAAARGLTVVDGLDMLIGQAIPSFEAFFGAPPPEIDARTLLLAALEGEG